MSQPSIHTVSVYYDDTDFSGVVYHANYLKYFERAREHYIGRDELVHLWKDEGKGFVVVKACLRYREGARFGDELEIRTLARRESAYRAVFDQRVFRVGGDKALVEGEIELCCVDGQGRLAPLPESAVS